MKLLLFIGTLLVIVSVAYGREEQGFDYEVDGKKFSLTPREISQTIDKTRKTFSFLEDDDEESIKKSSFSSLLNERGLSFQHDLSEIFNKSALDLVEKMDLPEREKYYIRIDIMDTSDTWQNLLHGLGQNLYNYKTDLKDLERRYKEMTPSEQEKNKDFYKKFFVQSTELCVRDAITYLDDPLYGLKAYVLDRALNLAEQLNAAESGADNMVESEKVARKIVDHFVSIFNN